MQFVQDEAELLASLVPLAGTRLVELGCGKAEFTRKLLLSPALHAEVRAKFEAHMTPKGARFERPMRVNLLRRSHAPQPQEK